MRDIQREVDPEELEAVDAIIKQTGGPSVAGRYFGVSRSTIYHWLKYGPDRGWSVAMGALFPKLSPKKWKVR